MWVALIPFRCEDRVLARLFRRFLIWCPNTGRHAWISAGTVHETQASAGGMVCGGPHVTRGGNLVGVEPTAMEGLLPPSLGKPAFGHSRTGVAHTPGWTPPDT